MLALYFTVFAVRPFSVPHWEALSGNSSALIAGLVFSIPAWMSLACLAYTTSGRTVQIGFANLCLLGILGLALNTTASVPLLLFGRVLFGIAVFFTMVRLDLVLFEAVQPQDYARAFGVMNIYQQLGALLSFYAAGYAVSAAGLDWPFWLGAGTFAITAVFYRIFFYMGTLPRQQELAQ